MNRPMATHRPKQRHHPTKAVPQQARVGTDGPEPFRVLIAVHRPRYRSRAERAVALPDWEVRSLLNREDPIGLINREVPHIFILSGDFGRNKDLGFLKAAQRYRGPEMKIIGLFDDKEEAAEAAELHDAALAPPWTTADLRAIAASFYAAQRGTPPTEADTIEVIE